MTRDDIIETALQCGVWIPMAHGQEREQTIDRLQRLVGRAVAEEREACAKVCERKGAIKYAGLTIGEQCAAAIRERGDA